MNPDNVKSCMRCDSDLERGYSSRYVNNECKEVICFKCDKKETLSDFLKTKVLTTRLIMDNSMDLFYYVESIRDPKRIQIQDLSELESLKTKLEIQIASLKIQEKIKAFEKKVWFAGLQEKVLATKCRGVSAKLKTHCYLSVLTYTIAGRTMITIEDKDSSVTCVADETSKESRTGLQGINAKLNDGLDLMDLAIELYENKTLKFKDDDKVGMI
jgi:hypothetical protein